MSPRRRLITKTEAARLAGVSPAAVSKLWRRLPADAKAHGKIWLDHPAVVAWLASHDARPPPMPAPTPPKPAPRPAPAQPKPVDPSEPAADSEPEVGPDLSDPADAILSLGLGLTRTDADYFAGMTLERIAREYGSMAVFADVLKAASVIAQIRERDDKHRREEGEVVTRELVTHAFGELERLSRHLLKPVPDTIVARTVDMHTGGKNLEEIRKVAREIVSSELKATWSGVSALLRRA